MSDDEMMARFFASYVPPTERPRVELVDCTCAGPDTHADECALVEQPESVEPVLPEGWQWHGETDDEYAHARHTVNGRIRVWWRQDYGLVTSRCSRGQFPEVERYVLWKNGVVK